MKKVYAQSNQLWLPSPASVTQEGGEVQVSQKEDARTTLSNAGIGMGSVRLWFHGTYVLVKHESAGRGPGHGAARTGRALFGLSEGGYDPNDGG